MRYGGFARGAEQALGGAWYGGFLMLFLGVFALVAVILIVVWMVRIATGHPYPWWPSEPSGDEESLAIAQARLASGEISRDEYEMIEGVLRP